MNKKKILTNLNETIKKKKTKKKTKLFEGNEPTLTARRTSGIKSSNGGRVREL
jgi:hypothetical protein